MKYFFGADVTDNIENETIDGNVFVTKEISAITQNSLDKSTDELIEMDKNGKLALPLRIIEFICSTAALLLAVGLINSISDITISEAYHNAPFLFYIFIICALTAAMLYIVGRRKYKIVSKSEEAVIAERRNDISEKNAYNELGVPDGALSVDVIMMNYKLKNGKIVLKTTAFFSCINPIMRMYKEDNYLCLADLEKKYSISLDSVTNIRKIKKHFELPFWNKEIMYNKGEYKKYKITENNGIICIKYAYALCIDYNGEIYELYFPPYELERFVQLTGCEVAPE